MFRVFLQQAFAAFHAFLFDDFFDSACDGDEGEVEGVGELLVGLAGEESLAEFFGDGLAGEFYVEFFGEGLFAGFGA